MVEEEWVEKLKKELNKFEIGDRDLDTIFEPLFEACGEVSKTYNDFKQCVNEGISTLKSVISKVK
jgi:chorismate mutase